ncbi:MAG: DUF4436 family protein [Acidobacteria bacterium]|nr:DUF4436 family protein [Acidobacteriota bacterium]
MEPSSGKSKTKLLLFIIAGILVFGVLFTLVLSLYRAEGVATTTEFAPEETRQPGHLVVDAKLVSLDPIKGDIIMRLQFSPEGNLVAEDGFSLAKNLQLDLNNSTGKTQYNFKKGERMNPTDVVFDVYGKIGDYPFDKHEASLILIFSAAKAGQENAPVEYDGVPFTVNYSGALAGYRIDASEAPDKETGFLQIDLDIKRSASAMTFSVFIMGLQWLLALSAISAAIVWVNGRKIEVTMFGWMGALLFALIPLRNAMPAVPPIGVLGDFLSFFWTETIVAISLIISVATWIFRSPAAK